MFKKKQDQRKPDINQQEISTIIGQGYVFKGELTGASIIRIEGRITGNVKVETGVILGEAGLIEGDIFTDSAIIYGTVMGNVHAGQLEIKKTGRIKGDISTNNLEIESGAQYNGTLTMQNAPQVNTAKVVDVSKGPSGTDNNLAV